MCDYIGYPELVHIKVVVNFIWDKSDYHMSKEHLKNYYIYKGHKKRHQVVHYIHLLLSQLYELL